LGIKKLKAVVGLSMGGLQAYEWAQSYPDSIERIVPVVATATAEPFAIAWLDIWAQPIRLDPKWNNGDYYGKESPLDGLKAALKIVSLQANGWEWARNTFGTAPAQEGKDPAKALANDFKIDAFLDQAAVARAAVADANHFLYLCKAIQLAAVDPAKIRVPALVLYAPTDQIFAESSIQETIQKITSAEAQSRARPCWGRTGTSTLLRRLSRRRAKSQRSSTSSAASSSSLARMLRSSGWDRPLGRRQRPLFTLSATRFRLAGRFRRWLFNVPLAQAILCG
jgi:homoserine O-acetyltransferase